MPNSPEAGQPSEPLTQEQIINLAHLATMEGLREPSDNEHPDESELRVRADKVVAQQPAAPDFGSDDTDEFFKAMLRGAIYAD